MAFVSTTLSAPEAAPAAATRTRPGFRSRLLRALTISRQRQADAEIARYLALSGGKMTDTAEREIERVYLTPRF